MLEHDAPDDVHVPDLVRERKRSGPPAPSNGGIVVRLLQDDVAVRFSQQLHTAIVPADARKVHCDLVSEAVAVMCDRRARARGEKQRSAGRVSLATCLHERSAVAGTHELVVPDWRRAPRKASVSPWKAMPQRTWAYSDADSRLLGVAFWEV